MTRLPLDLFVEVIDPAGARYRWDADQAPGSRLRNFSFRTKIGEGFSDASGQLARRIDRDYPDLDLIHDVSVVGADGSIAYEGRIAALPRELSDSHSVGVTLAGWMAHAKDRKFSEIYVDRDLSGWGNMTRQRRITLLGVNGTPWDPSTAVDPGNSQAGVSTSITGGWVSPYKPNAEAWYDAGPGLTVAKVGYSWRVEGSISAADTNWFWALSSSADGNAINEQTANLRAAGPSTLQTYTPATPRRYANLTLAYALTPVSSDGATYSLGWYKLAVYGNHGLPLTTGEPGEPAGVTASDVIRDIAGRFCPRLDTSGVQATSYAIQHLAFKDRTYPYDAFLEVNKYHLWHLGVWENKTLHFRPYDLTDYDWEIRTDDPGTEFSAQGPSTDDLFNGIVVTYTDLLTGVKNVLTPESNLELRDTSFDNPWNIASVNHWDEIELSAPTLANQALQVGRAALVSRNRPKTPGTITVKGHVRDRAGIDQPAWKVRAGDTIAITNFPNDAPRLIHETSYDNESKTATLSIDAPAQAIDAMFDRVATALDARGLS